MLTTERSILTKDVQMSPRGGSLYEVEEISMNNAGSKTQHFTGTYGLHVERVTELMPARYIYIHANDLLI